MLTLNDGRAELWQWDTGRTLTVDADCSQVHFSNKVFGRSIDVDVVGGAAIIPDVLLQTDKDLNVWAFVGTAENGYTKISKTFKVNRRNKPADYVFTPTDQMTLQTIQRQIGDLADLTTEAKGTLVAAINEAARTGGGAGSMELRVADGYVQYSTDGGMTWTNLIAMAELKGADGITPKIGDNGNWFLGEEDTGKPSRGATGSPGKDGADGAPGKDGAGMDVTGAAVGQIAKITAVDDSGKPTAWAPVDMPEKLPNPNALTFTGAVTGSYDGSAPMTVNIPAGGGGTGSGGESNLITRYIHSSNKEIYPTALDLETGVFTCENHGLTTGDAAIVVCDYWFSFIPYELIMTKRESISHPKIRVVDGNTFTLQYDNADITYTRNLNTNVDVTKWHIEISNPGPIEFTGFSAKSLEVRVSGWVWGTENFNLAVYPMVDGNQVLALNGSANYGRLGCDNNSTVCVFVSGTIYLNNEFECNSYVVGPPANDGDYTYGGKYPNLPSWGNRCATKKSQYGWPLEHHSKFDSVALCQNSMNSWNGGVLMVANGFTVEVYKHG